MNEVQTEKMVFANGELNALLRAMDVDVHRCRFCLEGSEEFVDVLFDNGCVKRVCVTGDSLKAVVLDVLKRV